MYVAVEKLTKMFRDRTVRDSTEENYFYIQTAHYKD